jgi:glutathione S-transferase
MTTEYKLYGHPVSPFSYLAHATLVHKGLNFEFVYIDLSSGAHKTEEYLEMNPYGQVPLLSVGDYNIYESWSIFEFLEEVHPEPNMLPLSQPARSKTRSLALSLLSGIIPDGRHLFLEALGRIELTPESRQSSADALNLKLNTFEKELLGIGKISELTPVDAAFFQAWQNISFGLPAVKETFPELESYFQSLKNQPTIKEIEKTPEVVQVRQFFKSLTPKNV